MSYLESALIIALTDRLKWSAALPPVDETTGTLTAVNPGNPFNVLDYTRRDREFQHRDMVNAAAVAKVSIFAQTVWNGTLVYPKLEGIAGVMDQTGTNVFMPLELSQIGGTLPNNSTGVTYVLNADVPYAAVQVTDVNLYNRDLMLYETLARSAALFGEEAPIAQIDSAGSYIGSTSAWASAQGTNIPALPNSALPMSQALFKDPDLYLAERDNQIAAYVSRIGDALKNPYEFATRIYVKTTGIDGTAEEESETYTLTENVFILGATYVAGDEVLYNGVWYQALNTTTDIPPTYNWTVIGGPTKLQFLAEPTLDSRNRIVYNKTNRTLQWFREKLDLVHVPKIVGFYVPGILPGQTIETVPLIPEKKDAQFWRQKSARVCLSAGSWSPQYVLSPTANPNTASPYVDGGLPLVFQDNKATALMMPDSMTINFVNVTCSAGTYALDCLVRPSPSVVIAGGDNQQGSVETDDGGTTFSAIGDVRNWQIELPAGGWKLYIEFENVSATATSSFGIKASQGATPILANTLPLYYTDSSGNPLPQNTIVTSPGIDVQSTGQSYNFSIQWTAGSGSFHIRTLRLDQVNGPATSHYIMRAEWIGAQGTNITAGTEINSISSLDVLGGARMPDVMPFHFYLAGTDTDPQITMAWLPKSGSFWQAKSYNPGDQVLYNLVYWQATAITTFEDVPGQSALWTQLGSEPQIPLMFEQIQLSKLVATAETPLVEGFQGFRQDMLERALRCDQDAYRLALTGSGTNYPEFRSYGSIWTIDSTGSWMSYWEVYHPRLRQAQNVEQDTITAGRQYQARTSPTGAVIYNAGTYSGGQKFYGVSGVTAYTIVGSGTVDQVGAYRPSSPTDIGKTGLIPAGLEFDITTGTVMAWYPSYASFPTHQAIQPWMIEKQFYVADDDFQSQILPLPDP